MSTLDPTTALVVVDLQEGLRHLDLAHPMPGVIGNAAALASSFRERGLPVVLVTANGRPPGRTSEPARARGDVPAQFAEPMHELGTAADDHRVVKQRWGAFTATDLDERLRSDGVTQVVVVGVATSIGVESTARSAYELGYHVTLATDAMTDREPDAHDNSVSRIFPKLGELTTTAEIIAALPNR